MAVSEVFQTEHLLSHFVVKVDGSDLPPEFASDVLEIVVENSLQMPDACSIRMHDWDETNLRFKWIDDETIREGKTIEVKMGTAENNLVSVFHGEVTALEMDAAGHMTPILTVRCVNRAHRLHRTPKRKTYQDVTDTDIVQKIAEDNGLTADADATTDIRHWVCQNNQTDWEFLQLLADRNSYRVYVEGERTLKFKPVQEQTELADTLEWGRNLRSFRPRLSTHGQVSEVTVRGWDPQTKQQIIGHKSDSQGVRSASIGEQRRGGVLAESAFGHAATTVVDWPVNSQSEAEHLAQSYIDSRETTAIEADGLCFGNPNVQPGKKVAVRGMGTRFSGDYYVTGTTHTFSSAEGFTSQFVCSGKNPNTLLGLLAGENDGQENYGGYIVIGLVTNNKDEDNQGRIKVKYPWLADDSESYWIRMVSPMAGNGRGIYYLPEVGDEVLVGFEHGDIHRAYMLGALWNGVDAPPEGNSAAVGNSGVNHRIIKTRAGHVVLLDDTDGAELVKITTKGGHVFTLDDGQKKITLVDSAGSETMTIDANSGNIEFKCNGNFSVEAMQKVLIKGQTGIEITTPMQAKLEGTTGVTVTTTAMLDLNGTTSQLKGTATVTIQGAMVNIN